MTAQLKKLECYIDPKKALWLLNNYHKVHTRLLFDYTYNPIEKVKELCKLVSNTKDGIIQVNYKYAKNMSSGRQYEYIGTKMLGLQSLLREYRHTLCNSDYWDIDVVNCQPVILYQYCKKNNIKCPRLEDYVNNRDSILAKVAEETQLKKIDIKEQILKILMGGKINNDMININTIENFYNEIQVIQPDIVNLNKKHYKFAKQKKDFNLGGSTTAYLLQEIENEIIMSAERFLSKNGYKVGCIIYDGLMVRIDTTRMLNDEILNHLSDYVFSEIGYRVKFVNKKMEEGYKIPDEELNNINIKHQDCIIIETDDDASNILLEELKKSKNIIKCGDRYFYKVRGSIYKEDKSIKNQEIKRILLSYISKKNFCKESIKNDGSTEIIPYSKNAHGAKQIYALVEANLQDDKEFVKNIFYSNLHKLCFINGYYDFKLKKFIKWEDSNNKVMTLIYIDKEYNVDDKLIEERQWIQDKILDPILGTGVQQKYFLQWASRAISGAIEDKSFGIGLGNRNCGKSVLTELFRNSFEEYIRDFNGEDLLCKKGSSGDTAKGLSWLLPFEYTRLNISNELNLINEKGQKLIMNGVTLKSIASGGDVKTARANYKEEVQFKLQGKTLLFMNEIMQVNPTDALKTAVTFEFNSEFKNELTENDKKFNEKKDCKYKFKLADPSIKEELLNNKGYQMAFIKIIIENYCDKEPKLPEELKNINEDMHDTSDSVKNKLEELFIFTLEDDMMLVSDVNDKIKNYFGNNINKSAYKLLFNQMGIIEKRKADARYYIGIKLKE